MARVTSKARGIDALAGRLAGLSAAGADAAGEALAAVADEAAASIRRAFPRQSGPSAPGGPPADPKGRLAAAVTATRRDGVPGAVLEVDLPFARDLEYGTTRMAARPFLHPAALRAGADAGDRLASGLAARLKEPPR